MFGATFAASRPRGLQRLVLASGLASKDLSIRSIQIRRSELPRDTIKVMDEHEWKRDCKAPAYLEALKLFTKTFVCREEPLPPELIPAFKHLNEDKTVNMTMYVSVLKHLFLILLFMTSSSTFSPHIAHLKISPFHAIDSDIV